MQLNNMHQLVLDALMPSQTANWMQFHPLPGCKMLLDDQALRFHAETRYSARNLVILCCPYGKPNFRADQLRK